MKHLPLLLTALLLAGCASAPWNSSSRATSGSQAQVVTGRALTAASAEAFPDVPLPSGYKLDLDNTMVFTSPSQTMGKLSAVGSKSVDEVFRFYQDQMTAKGWSLVNAFQSSTASLYFAKPGKFAAIIIEDRGWGGSRVMLNVGPE